MDKTSAQLLMEIEKKNRKYKFFVVCSIVTFFAFAGIMLVIGLKTLQSQKETTDTIRRNLDCIVIYFEQRNRTELTIEDISKCTLSRDGGTPQDFFETNDEGETEIKSSTQPPPKVSQQAPPASPLPSEPVAPKPQDQPTPEESKPIDILPTICVPLTNVCVNQ